MVLVGKYGAKRHIDGTEPPADDPNWETNDYAVLSLLYASVSEDILGIIMTPNALARAVWTSIQNLFQDNKQARALNLEAEFRNLAQGDMSIMLYAQKLKSYADALADIGQPVNDETLVLTLLRGLSENYRPMATVIKTKDPFPSFLQARSLLLLEEAQPPSSPSPRTPPDPVLAPTPPPTRTGVPRTITAATRARITVATTAATAAVPVATAAATPATALGKLVPSSTHVRALSRCGPASGPLAARAS